MPLHHNSNSPSARLRGRVRSLFRRVESGVVIKDRPALHSRLRLLERQAASGSDPALLKAALEDLEGRVAAAEKRRMEKIAGLPSLFYPEALPITARREAIVAAIRQFPVVVVSGETGSGKTTQIPKFCLEAGRGIDGMIGCTQPRRIAAITVSRRIAEELGDPAMAAVGYQVRFQDRTPPNAYIKLMTDGILLAESQRDRGFYRYDTLIVDEAHERSLNIDFILGLLRRILARRRDLKVIVTSATIDTEKFSKAFDGAPVIEVSGRTYPVTVHYRPLVAEDETDAEAPDDAPSYVEEAVKTVTELHARPVRGDILVFMPTERDIQETCGLLEARGLKNATLFPLFARLPAERQAKVFSPCVGRKIIVSTNIAETSLTIPGIRYVVDTGLARISRYIPRTRTTALPVSPISKASADQRMGRCGRVAHGVCIRLYGEQDYLSREAFTPPEILRANLADVILRMVALGIGDADDFPFIDPPDPRSVRDGYELLFELGALIRTEDGTGRKGGRGRKARLSDIGRVMARFPLDPRLSRVLIESLRENCLDEALVLVAALSIPDPRERPVDAADAADQAQREFVDPLSDFVTLLNIWKKARAIREGRRPMGGLKAFCKKHFISFRRMREWWDIHDEIGRMLEEEDIRDILPPPKPARGRKAASPFGERYGALHRAILSGFLSSVAMRKEKNQFMAAHSRAVMLFPGSGLFNRPPEWIVAAEMVETSRPFARTAAAIDPRWIEPLAGELCRHVHENPRWEQKRGEVVATERVLLFGLPVVAGRGVAYGRIDPDGASEIFIRSALMEREIRPQPKFLLENRRLEESLRRMEDKLRRRDLVATDAAIFAFYADRLKGVSDTRTLARIIREKGDGALRMTREDLLQRDPDAEALSLYPDRLSLGERHYDLDYRFTPGQEVDGVTVRIPAARAGEVPHGDLEWLVPGLLEEKVTALLKGLPKALRKRLVPVNRTAQTVVQEMPKTSGSLTSRMAAFIFERFGVDIPAMAWTEKALPDHLKARIALTDAKGNTLRAGRDPDILKSRVSQGVDPAALKAAREKWERGRVEDFQWETLPESVAFSGEGGSRGVVYPGLSVDEKTGGGVRLRLFEDRQAARESHLKGVTALFCRRFSKEMAFLRRSFNLSFSDNPATADFGGPRAFVDRMVQAVAIWLFSKDIRTREAFEAIGAEAAPRILSTGADLAAAVQPVLEAYGEAKAVLGRTALLSEGKGPLHALVEELQAHLGKLVPPDVMIVHDMASLHCLARHVRAVGIRAERALVDLEKDRAKAGRVAPFVAWVEGVRAALDGQASKERREAVRRFETLLEEFKVSVFAQELGTAERVSEKLLREMMARIHRMP